MRSFYAIELDDATRRLLSGIQTHLRQEGMTGNFSFPDNLHLTVKFLGEIDRQQFAQARDLLQKAAGKYRPFVLKFHSIGKFEKRGKLIVWAGLEKEEHLFSLNREIEHGIRTFIPGIEEMSYTPHITLAREAVLSRQFDKLSVLKEESFTAMGLSLMESMRVNGRLTYVRRAYEPFMAE